MFQEGERWFGQAHTQRNWQSRALTIVSPVFGSKVLPSKGRRTGLYIPRGLTISPISSPTIRPGLASGMLYLLLNTYSVQSNA